MINAVLLGAGNLASQLYRAFATSQQLRFIQVYNRNKESVDFIDSNTKLTDNLEELLKADIYFICVSDTAIHEVSKKLPFTNRLVVHCSGGLPMEVLDTKNRIGVFYPLQTFIKNVEVDFHSIPICIEADQAKDKEILMNLGRTISQNVQEINSQQRSAIHVAAVFVNNFTNYLFQIGEEILQENQMEFSLLHPLIKRTIESVLLNSPKEIQTGPAKRGDKVTIEKHLGQLEKNNKEIYKTITNAILLQYGREKL